MMIPIPIHDDSDFNMMATYRDPQFGICQHQQFLFSIP